jgi:hypothetical protein
MQRTQNDFNGADLLDTLDVELLTSIQTHVAERGGSSSAYVVPMKSIFSRVATPKNVAWSLSRLIQRAKTSASNKDASTLTFAPLQIESAAPA